MKWCPSAGCTNAIKVEYIDAQPVSCDCGFRFCFQCVHEWHDPVKCSLLKKWLVKIDEDYASCSWISTNTKNCPKCNASIEKNGGCNHMICTNVACMMDFCWSCLQPWTVHGYERPCNRYEPGENKALESQERARAELKRFLFYSSRYENHQKSLGFENNLRGQIKEKMNQLQEEYSMSFIEVQFLKKAVDVLCHSRQILMYSYAFAFYLKKTNQAIIFEDNQGDLETATEKLSEYLERNINEKVVGTIKQDIEDRSGYCDSRSRALLEHVHEGYEKDW